MLVWLHDDAPNTDTMHHLLNSAAFRKRVEEFIKFNIRADVEGLNETTIKNMPRETQIAYSRPPDPDQRNWEELFRDRLQRVVRSQQLHSCTRATCLRYDLYGRLLCKRRAPWEVSEDTVMSNGEYQVRRIIPFVNNFNPTISVALNCNNESSS